VEDAMNAMGQGFDTTYYPDKSKVALYAARYKKYHHLGGFVESTVKAKSKETALSN
jgi:L-ribulokinase